MPSPPSPDLETELGKARDLGIDACGRIAEFWGFTRTMGRAFGLLYLSHEPLPQSEIQKRLGISAGSASMTLAALGRWGVVHRVWVRGQRREHYQAETDFWKMISGVLNERERREIGAAVEVVQRAEAGARAVHTAVKTATTGAPRRLRGEAEFTVDRLVKLGEICRLGETMLDMLLGQLTLDVGRFRDVLKGDQGTPEGPPALPAAPANVAAGPAPRPPAASSSHRVATREKKPRR